MALGTAVLIMAITSLFTPSLIQTESMHPKFPLGENLFFTSYTFFVIISRILLRFFYFQKEFFDLE